MNRGAFNGSFSLSLLISKNNEYAFQKNAIRRKYYEIDPCDCQQR